MWAGRVLLQVGYGRKTIPAASDALGEFLARQRGSLGQGPQLARRHLARKRRQAAIGAGIQAFGIDEFRRRADGGGDRLGASDFVAGDVDGADHHFLVL